MPERPEAVILTVRCLAPGCGLEVLRASVGLELDDVERLQTAEAVVDHHARRCRNRHVDGVEARFSDQPDRRLVFSQCGGTWHES